MTFEEREEIFRQRFADEHGLPVDTPVLEENEPDLQDRAPDEWYEDWWDAKVRSDWEWLNAERHG